MSARFFQNLRYFSDISTMYSADIACLRCVTVAIGLWRDDHSLSQFVRFGFAWHCKRL